jgi:integrase
MGGRTNPWIEAVPGSSLDLWFRNLVASTCATMPAIGANLKRCRNLFITTTTPKAYKEREIPVPDKLMKSLQPWKKKANKNCPLLFPTAGCNPKLDFLDCLKDVAKRAGLNCKHCDTCKKYDKCERWFLHKFRATFATWASEKNVSVPTVKLWLGHSDTESTMRYLKPARGPLMREKVNEIFA